MNKAKSSVNEFLKKYGMHYDSIDIDQCCDVFIKDMEKGLNGEESSLKMLVTYISLEENIPLEEPVIVMDAGGTNFRVAVVTFDKNKQPVIEDFKTYPMPGTKGELSKEEFFKVMAQYLEPVANKSDKIGFCFSYPTEILPNKDGKLIHFNKEVKVRDMEGVQIGSNLLQALKDAGIKGDKKIVLLNDTVADLLGGKAAYPDRKFESYIGFILGTGTNTCYIEDNAKMKKAQVIAAKEGSSIINIESGGYAKAPRGEIDIIVDNGTTDPGRQQFEKMISGAYQGTLLFETFKKAAQDGLLSKQFAARLNEVKGLTSREIDDFCYYPYGDNAIAKCIGVGSSEEEKDDRLKVFYMIDALMERAAKLVAINIASVILKSGKGKDPSLPVCVAADGTTFYKSKLFRGKLDYYVKVHLNEKMGIYCEFVKAENANLVGTAIAGLLA